MVSIDYMYMKASEAKTPAEKEKEESGHLRGRLILITKDPATACVSANAFLSSPPSAGHVSPPFRPQVNLRHPDDKEEEVGEDLLQVHPEVRQRLPTPGTWRFRNCRR